MRLAALALVLTASPALAQPGGAVRRVGSADGFRRAVAAAKPGDRILLLPGDYRGLFYFKDVHGAAGRPITIAAADPKRPPRFVGDDFCVQFSGVSHLTLADLTLTRARQVGLNVDDQN